MKVFTTPESPHSVAQVSPTPADAGRGMRLGAAMWNLWLIFRILYEVAYIVYRTKRGIRIWWYRRRGRHADADAIIADFVQYWGRRTMKKHGCEVEVIGLENLPPSGPMIIMTNHQSLFDIPIFLSYLGGLNGFVAKKELFRIPGWGYWMKQIHCMSIDRADVRTTVRLYEALGGHLKETETGFIIFPEGTRTRDPDGAIGEFKPGSVRLATSQGIPILPVSIDGTRYMGRGEALYRTRNGGRRVRVKIAPLIHSNAKNGKERQELIGRIREVIVSNFDSIKLDWPCHSPAKAAK